jgi:hypothetical protein
MSLRERDYPSLDFSIEETRLFFQHSIDRLERIDTIAGIIIGINVTIISILISQRIFFDPWFWGFVMLLPFLMSAVFSLCAIRVTNEAYPSDPTILDENYVDKELVYTKYNIFLDYKEAVSDNDEMFDSKIKPLRLSVYALISAVLLLTVMASITYSVL